MFTKLLVLLLASLTYSTHCTPVQTTPDHDMKQFLDSRIVGGIDAPPEYGRYMAALVFGEITANLMCGGSIVTKRHILTAAHCIEPLVIWGQLMASFRAVIGSHKWTSTQKNIRFTGYINHPRWNWNTLKNDIGVLFLSKEVELSKNVAIIPLKTGWVDGGAKSFVTGWGRLGASHPLPDKLQLLYVHTITAQQCFDGIAKASEGWGRVPPHDPNLEICTFHSFGHGMCNGDSGSALVLKKTQEQIGIVSWGFPCARGAPDMYVRVSSYINWLEDIIWK